MLKECSNCKSKISYVVFCKQTLRNKYRFKCPKCGTDYKVTIFSITVNFFVFMIPFTYLLVEKKFLLNFIWLLIFNFGLQPLILHYKAKI